MSFFLNEKVGGTLSDTQPVLAHEPYQKTQDGTTGYEYTVNMATMSQTPAVIQTIQEV
jgi:hypothetical protein